MRGAKKSRSSRRRRRQIIARPSLFGDCQVLQPSSRAEEHSGPWNGCKIKHFSHGPPDWLRCFFEDPARCTMFDERGYSPHS